MTKFLPVTSEILIIDLFKRFARANISYVVLRNYDGLPHNIGHDIDLLVDDTRIADVIELCITLAENHKWIIIQKSMRYGFFSFTMIPPLPHGTADNAVKIDIWAPIFWRGFPWIDCNFILNTKIKHNQGFFIPTKGAEAAILLLKDLIQAGKIKTKYFSRIHQFCLDDPLGFNNALIPIFGKKIVSDLLLYVNEKKWDEIERNFKILRFHIVRSSLKKSLTGTIINSLKFISGHSKDYFHGKTMRNRIFLCLIGPDGSGKSTIASKISENMSINFENIHYFHGHYNILPALKLFIPQKVAFRSENELSCNKITRWKKFLAAFLILYYSIDYILGYIVYVPKKDQGDLIIFDRYFFDYMIQPSPVSGDSVLFKFLIKIIPKPDLTIYPYAPPEVVYYRKPELDPIEIKRQAEICEKLIDILPSAYRIDNTIDLDDVILHIHNLILNKISTKLV